MHSKNIIQKNILFLSDWLMTLLSFHLAIIIREYLGAISHFSSPFEIQNYYALSFIISFLWVGILRLFQAYAPFSPSNIISDLWILIKSILTGCVALGLIIFLGKFVIFSRLVYLLFPVINLFLLLLLRLFYYRWIFKFPLFQSPMNHCLILSDPRTAKKTLEQHPIFESPNVKILGLVDYTVRSIHPPSESVQNIPVLGALDDFLSLIKKSPIDTVIVIPRATEDLERLKGLMVHCEELGKTVHLISDFFRTFIAKLSIDHYARAPILTFHTTPQNPWELFIKRIFDIIFSISILILLAPVLLLVGGAIALFSGRPIFYIQERIGLHGRPFMMIKFRSMRIGAESQIDALQTRNERDPPVFKIRSDPRVTRIGRFLRKTSLDEFPQFWNVLRGDMSVVGPRPPIAREVEAFLDWHRRRLSMKPGITCLWQIHFRSGHRFDDCVKLDLDYIDSWSLFMDFMIILKTIPLVISCKGAE